MKIIKILFRFLLGIIVGGVGFIVILYIFDLGRLNKICGDWARRYGYYQDATVFYSSSIRINGYQPIVFNNRGVSRYHQQYFEEAIKDYDRAIELDPQYPTAYRNRAVAFLNTGKAAETKRDFDIACKLGKCEDFSRLQAESKIRCEQGECTPIETGIKAGLWQK